MPPIPLAQIDWPQVTIGFLSAVVVVGVAAFINDRFQRRREAEKTADPELSDLEYELLRQCVASGNTEPGTMYRFQADQDLIIRCGAREFTSPEYISALNSLVEHGYLVNESKTLCRLTSKGHKEAYR